MKRIHYIRIISYCIAAVIVAVGFIVKTQGDVRQYRLEIENNYSRSLDELNSGVNNISLLLQKAEFATSQKQMSRTATELLGESQTAKTALLQLPNGEEQLTVLNRFLSQVGNYAMAISKNISAESSDDEEISKNITALRKTAEKVAQAVSDSQISYNNTKYWATELAKQLDDTVDKDSLEGSLGELENSLSDYPTLVYDGPYSDHILEKEPEMTKNAKNITEEKALEEASKITGYEEEKLKFDGIDNGKIPVYRFSNDELSVTISEKGGFPVYMRKTRTVDESTLEYHQVLDKAKRYMESIGFTGFKDTYYFTDDGVCVINFAYIDGVTICYTDLIKVGVAMDTGEICLLETTGYLANHKDRAFKTPEVSEEKAATAVSSKLQIKEKALALIPTDSGGETRCYEFVCASEDKQDILVYINAVTGEEEEIMILLKSDGGTLAK